MKNHLRLLGLILVFALLAGCTPVPNVLPTATPTPPPTATAAPTETSVPSPTPSPEPTAIAESVINYPPIPEAKENWDGELQLWINPDYVFPGVVVALESPSKVGLFLEEALDANKGFSELVGSDQVREYLVKNNGIVPNLGIPVEDGYDDSKGQWGLVKFIKQGQIDLKQPVEVRMYFAGDQRIEKDLDQSTIIWLQEETREGMNFSIRNDGGLVYSMIIRKGSSNVNLDAKCAQIALMRDLFLIYKYQVPGENSTGALLSSMEDSNARDYYLRTQSWFILK